MSDSETYEGGHSTGSQCMNCGQVRRDVSENGGWCGPCCGEQQAFDAAACLTAIRKTEARAAVSPSYQRLRAEANRALAAWEKGRKARKSRFGEVA